MCVPNQVLAARSYLSEFACVDVVLGLVIILEIMFNPNQVFICSKK